MGVTFGPGQPDETPPVDREIDTSWPDSVGERTIRGRWNDGSTPVGCGTNSLRFVDPGGAIRTDSSDGVTVSVGGAQSDVEDVHVLPPADAPPDATLRRTVDGEVRRETTLDRKRLAVPAIVEAVTAPTTVEPGDVVTTGTSGGVAYLAEGERVSVEIEGIGTLAPAVERPA